MGDVVKLDQSCREETPSEFSEDAATILSLPGAKGSLEQRLSQDERSRTKRKRKGHRFVMTISEKSPETYEKAYRLLAERHLCEVSD